MNLKQLSKGNVLVFGDIILDKYISGTVDRVSPEAPVPVHKVENKQKTSTIYGKFDKQIIHIKDPRRAFERRSSSYRSDRELDISSMYSLVKNKNDTIELKKKSIDSLVSDMMTVLIKAYDTKKNTFGVQDHYYTDSIKVEINSIQDKLEKNQDIVTKLQAQIDEYQVEIHKKFSIPAACIVFTLIGAPLGAQIRRHGATVSVAISLTFFWVYWLFLIGGEELADRGFVEPALAMWAPNLTFSCLGIILIYRFTRGHNRKFLSRISP